MARQKASHTVRHRIFGGEKRIGELLFKIAVQVEIGATGVDQHAAGVVVDEERQVHTIADDLDPLLILAVLFVLPDQSAEVVTGAPGDGRDHGVRTHGLATDFNHSHGGAAKLRERSVKNQAAALQQAESVNEKA